MRVPAGLAWIALLLGLAACVSDQSLSAMNTSSPLTMPNVGTTEAVEGFIDDVSGPDPDGRYRSLEQAVEAARTCWEERGLDDYHLAVEFGGMAVTAPVLARVVDGEVVDTYPSTQQWSAEWLFQLVQDIVASQPDVIGVTFDPHTCHVTSIGVDQDTEAIDDEYGYDVYLTAEAGGSSGSALVDDSSLPPPVIHLVTGEETTLLHPYDYCWGTVCVDSFGSQEPDRAEIHDDFAVLLWRGDGALLADIDHNGCRTPLTLEQSGPGTWRVAVPERPGESLIHFNGSTGEGTTLFLLEASTDSPGPQATPRVEIGWPTTSDARWISFEIIGYLGEEQQATFTVEDTNGDRVTTIVDLAVIGDPVCPRLSAEFEIDDSVNLETTLIAHLQLDNYSVTFEWPAELADQPRVGSLVRSMTASP